MANGSLNLSLQGLVVIGSSTGGIDALSSVLDKIRLKATILIVQHMPSYINERLRKRIKELSEMPCILPAQNEVLQPNTIYLAPSEFHLLIGFFNRVELTTTEKVQWVRPSVDVTMMSLKANSAKKLTGIILTGMGQDGAAGIKHMKSIGALTIAQDPKTCPAPSMPASAIRTEGVDLILPTPGIRRQLIAEYGQF